MEQPPHLWIRQFGEVGLQVEDDAVHGPVQGDAPDKQDGEDDVREDGREVDHLATPLDAAPHAEVDEDPDGQQGDGQLPHQAARRVDSGGKLQHATPVLWNCIIIKLDKVT